MNNISTFISSRTFQEYFYNKCEQFQRTTYRGVAISCVVGSITSLFYQQVSKSFESEGIEAQYDYRLRDLNYYCGLGFIAGVFTSSVTKFLVGKIISRNLQTDFEPCKDIEELMQRNDGTDYLMGMLSDFTYLFNIESDSFATERDWIDLVRASMKVLDYWGVDDALGDLEALNLDNLDEDEKSSFCVTLYALFMMDEFSIYLNKLLKTARADLKSTQQSFKLKKSQKNINKRRVSTKNPGEILKKKQTKIEKLKSRIEVLSEAVEKWNDFFDRRCNELGDLLRVNNPNKTPKTRDQWSEMLRRGILPNHLRDLFLDKLVEEQEQKLRQEQENNSEFDTYFYNNRDTEKSYKVQARERLEEFEERKKRKERLKINRYNDT